MCESNGLFTVLAARARVRVIIVITPASLRAVIKETIFLREKYKLII